MLAAKPDACGLFKRLVFLRRTKSLGCFFVLVFKFLLSCLVVGKGWSACTSLPIDATAGPSPSSVSVATDDGFDFINEGVTLP